MERYSRGLVPSQSVSLPDALDTEFLKLERAIDAILAALVVLQAQAADHEARITALEP